ncbi:hypothetical protein ACJX0J_007412 [Zea mays]
MQAISGVGFFAFQESELIPTSLDVCPITTLVEDQQLTFGISRLTAYLYEVFYLASGDILRVLRICLLVEYASESRKEAFSVLLVSKRAKPILGVYRYAS